MKIYLDKIKSKKEFKHFPNIEEREKWESVPSSFRAQIIENAEKYFNNTWVSLKITDYAVFSETGARTPYELPYFARRRAFTALVLAECIENSGRFINDIINGIFCVCEETSWVIPAHNIFQNGTKDGKKGKYPSVETQFIDLFSAETGSLIAMAYYLLKPVIPVPILERMEYEVQRRIIDPYINLNNLWWENAVNNWNVWCTSNCLNCLFIMEKSSQKREAGVKKAINSIETFINLYSADGGCDEGPDYWNMAAGAFYTCLTLLDSAFENGTGAFEEDIVKKMGMYIVNTHISGNRFANFADSKVRVPIDEAVVYGFGVKTNQPSLKSLGIYTYNNTEIAPSVLNMFSLLKAVPNVICAAEMENASVDGLFPKDSYYPDLQLITMRSENGTDKGFYLAVKGGHNGEAHNHNDVGQFVLYCDGLPVFIDPGVERYTARTFSSERYEIWTMRSEYHNLPTINGFCQHEGAEFKAKEFTGGNGLVSMELKNAYEKEAGIEFYKRTLKLDECICEITDEYSVKGNNSKIIHNFLTAYEPERVGENSYIIKVGDKTVSIFFKGERLTFSVECIDIADEHLASFWDGRLYRIQIMGTKSKSKLHVKVGIVK